MEIISKIKRKISYFFYKRQQRNKYKFPHNSFVGVEGKMFTISDSGITYYRENLRLVDYDYIRGY